MSRLFNKPVNAAIGERYQDQGGNWHHYGFDGITLLQDYAARALWSGCCPEDLISIDARVSWAIEEAKALILALDEDEKQRRYTEQYYKHKNR